MYIKIISQKTKMCCNKYEIKKHIFFLHNYFCCFTYPSTVCVDKKLYKKFTYAAEIKN